MRWLILVAALGCKSADPGEPRPAPKPPDDMDEKMRHCPLALDGAVATLEDIAGGVRFAVTAPERTVADARRRAHHLVEFAAKRTREGHGEFDGKGGGHMKNCPVVTEGVAIAVADTASGVQLDVVAAPGAVDRLRAESRERARRFAFTGARVSLAAPP